MLVTIYGMRIMIRTNTYHLLDEVGDYLPPGFKACSGVTAHRTYSVVISGVRPPVATNKECIPHVRHSTETNSATSNSLVREAGTEQTPMYSLYRASTSLVHTDDPREIFITLESDLNIYIAACARHHLFVHAGVIEWNDAAIILPGRSCSGKTSLVQACIEVGAMYYSDEYAVLDSKGRVHPFPKLLSIRETNGRRKRRVRVSATQTGCKPVSVQLVVDCSFREGAAWDVVPLSCGLTALSLLANTVPAQTRPAFALAVLGRVVTPDTKGFRGVRGEARDAVGSLLHLLQ
jgi:hypothetical protein